MQDLRNQRLDQLLAYIDLSLPSAARHALLGVAAGFSRAQLRALPGLGNATRLHQVLETLVQTGRVRLQDDRYEAGAGMPPTLGALERELKRSKKFRHALELLLDPAGGLRARGLGRLADALGPERSEALERVLREADARLADDCAVRRRLRRSVVAFAERNVPPDLVQVTPEGIRPRPAPPDVIERSIQVLTADMPQPIRDERRRELEYLYDTLLPYGEAVLAHWWRILEALVARGVTGASLWSEWRLRLESYRLRRRIPLPGPLRIPDLDARLLRATHPVPDYGYGPWVDEELELWQRFRRLFGPALGPYTRDLWVRAHEAMDEELCREYAGAAPATVGPAHYEEVLFQVAERLSGLGPAIVSDLRVRRRTPRIRAARAIAERKWTAMREHAALRKAMSLLADDRLGDCPLPPADRWSPRAWAFRLAWMLAGQKLGEAVNASELAELIERAPGMPGKGGRRRRRPTLAERALRTLHNRFDVAPVHLVPGRPFPLADVIERLQPVLSLIRGRGADGSEERARAVREVRDALLHRTLIHVIYAGGTYERRTLVEAARLSGEPGVVESILGMVEGEVGRSRTNLDRAAA